MAFWKIDNDNLRAIANKLREVNEDDSLTYTIDDFPAAIRALTPGPGTCNFGWNSKTDPTRITLNITNSWVEGYKVGCMYRFDPDSSITINWGDGTTSTNYSATEYITKEFTHTYLSGGNYEISVTKSGTCVMYRGFGLVKK